jgi:hypothetical protein
MRCSSTLWGIDVRLIGQGPSRPKESSMRGGEKEKKKIMKCMILEEVYSGTKIVNMLKHK